MSRIPITYNFDNSTVVGWLEFNTTNKAKDLTQLFIEGKINLSPAFSVDAKGSIHLEGVSFVSTTRLMNREDRRKRIAELKREAADA